MLTELQRKQYVAGMIKSYSRSVIQERPIMMIKDRPVKERAEASPVETAVVAAEDGPVVVAVLLLVPVLDVVLPATVLVVLFALVAPSAVEETPEP